LLGPPNKVKDTDAEKLASVGDFTKYADSLKIPAPKVPSPQRVELRRSTRSQVATAPPTRFDPVTGKGYKRARSMSPGVQYAPGYKSKKQRKAERAMKK
jgi:hypothetical protein